MDTYIIEASVLIQLIIFIVKHNSFTWRKNSIDKSYILNKSSKVLSVAKWLRRCSRQSIEPFVKSAVISDRSPLFGIPGSRGFRVLSFATCAKSNHPEYFMDSSMRRAADTYSQKTVFRPATICIMTYIVSPFPPPEHSRFIASSIA